ncbi:hypothetical protein [Streptosporangium sp. NPDC051022]|uniref:hypothetical protein n=1 Tax=Streptosporangium sp. NPDC051022 TaxID=3155752 RepID=UPI0034247B55
MAWPLTAFAHASKDKSWLVHRAWTEALKGIVITPAKSKIRPRYDNAPPRTVSCTPPR